MSRVAALLFLASCYVAPVNPQPQMPPSPVPYQPPVPRCMDQDQDGWCQETDCNDSDPRIHPDAPDPLADGVDQNCDGLR